MDNLISIFDKCLPDVLWRANWSSYQKFHGIPFSKSTMENRDHLGTGPKAGKLGKRIFYKKSDFLEWLAGQISEAC